MTRALAASRSYWWGRDPAQAWTYTSYVLAPAHYLTALQRLGAWWTAEPIAAIAPGSAFTLDPV